MSYGFVSVAGRTAEVCDECGFNGSLVDRDDAVERLRSIPDEWDATLLLDEPLARRRPEAATWCGVEYTLHTIHILRSVDWQARQFVARAPTSFELVPADIAAIDPGPMSEHSCEGVELAGALEDLRSACGLLGGYAAGLTAEELGREGNYGGSEALRASTLDVVRHGLHDANHHLLDIQRASARALLALAH